MTLQTGSQRSRLLVFAKYPEAGKAKTRLIPALGADRAARLHAAMTRRTLELVRQFCVQHSCDLDVYFAEGCEAQMESEFGRFRYVAQRGDHLGDKLEHATAGAFSEGASCVVVIGTDCPELTPAILNEALEALRTVDAVMGPALDGGYFLIGLKKPQPILFRDVDWGTNLVLQQTLAHARRMHLTVHQLTPLSDVDYPEDLIICRRLKAGCEQALPEIQRGIISVVIPTLNEERVIEQTLRQFDGLQQVEIIVADGGSTDATSEIAQRMGIAVVPVNSGRGRQLNAGAALATGEVILFLHADTRLPAGFQEIIWSTLNSGAIAGAFRLRIDGAGVGLRIIEWSANFRSRMLQRPYGDQAMFLRAETFFALGGFPNWRLMEDVGFAQRLRMHGRIQIAKAEVITSARRWKRLGIWKTTLMNQLCVAGFHLGIGPDTLARLYRR